MPIFGTAPDACLLVVGLAPGLRGANRTGRPFTGDYAGELLYRTLIAHGFASGRYEARPDDGLTLIDCVIANAVRCVPPQNKPLPEEIRTCRPFLEALVGDMPHLKTIVALGRIAHESVVRLFGMRLAATPFGHGKQHCLSTAGRSIALIDSYHCSRYNTNTGVLTEIMFDAIFAAARTSLDDAIA